MSTTPEKKPSPWQPYLSLLGCAALIVAVIGGIWKGGNIWIERVVNSENMQVSEAVTKEINKSARLDLFMPELVFVNIDSSQKKGLTDSIKKQIANALVKRYTDTSRFNPSAISFQPFFVFPDTSDKNGNYNLTKHQLEELKNHIAFLTSQVDKAVSETKAEINKEIDRINTWVSIWIGVIGFLGIFVPIVINVRGNEEVKEIKEKADGAKSTVDEVEKYINENKEDIKNLKSLPANLEGLRVEFTTLQGNINAAIQNSDQATQTANIALDGANRAERLVRAVNYLGKLKDLDGVNLLHNENPILTLRVLLSGIHDSLNHDANLFAEPFMTDLFRQLSNSLRLISVYDFIIPENLVLINQFIENLQPILEEQFIEQTFAQAIQFLNDLKENLIIEE